MIRWSVTNVREYEGWPVENSEDNWVFIPKEVIMTNQALPLTSELAEIFQKAQKKKCREEQQEKTARNRKVNQLIKSEIMGIIENLPEELKAQAEFGRKECSYQLLPNLSGYRDDLSIPFGMLPAIIRLSDYCDKNNLKLKVDTGSHDCAAILHISW